MYKLPKYPATSILTLPLAEGETIEHKMERVLANKEAITDGAPIIYTERKDGVIPAYDIRTDRWEIAAEAMDKVHASRLAERKLRHMSPEEKEEYMKKVNSDPKVNEVKPTLTTGISNGGE